MNRIKVRVRKAPELLHSHIKTFSDAGLFALWCFEIDDIINNINYYYTNIYEFLSSYDVDQYSYNIIPSNESVKVLQKLKYWELHYNENFLKLINKLNNYMKNCNINSLTITTGEFYTKRTVTLDEYKKNFYFKVKVI